MTRRVVVAPAAWAVEIDGWVASLRAAGRPDSTVKLRAYHLSRLGEALGGSPWEVTGDELVGWVGGQVWEAETRRSWRSSLRGFWAWGLRTGRTAQDPALELPSVRPSEPAPAPAPEEAWHGALAAADARARLMLRLAGEMGMRRGEIALVHARDVVADLAGWSLIVHGKGARTRVLPMPAGLAAEVREACRAGAGGWAFPGRIDGHLSAQRVGRIVSGLLPEGVTAHKCRHRAATRVHAAGGRDVLLTQRFLGHASPVTTQRYVLVELAGLRAAVEDAAA